MGTKIKTAINHEWKPTTEYKKLSKRESFFNKYFTTDTQATFIWDVTAVKSLNGNVMLVAAEPDPKQKLVS